MARMSPAELDARLRRGGACRIGCLDAAGNPYVVPVAYFFSQGQIHLAARARATWAAHLLRDARISVCIDGDEPGVGNWRIQIQGRAHLAAGPVSGRELPSYADGRALAERDGWLDYFLTVSDELYYDFAIQPEQTTTWRGSDWARRYKHGDWHA
jgi:hypothetical protein